MKKSKLEIENEKFWNDFFRQARQIRRNAIEEEIQQKKDEQNQKTTKKSFFLKGFKGQNQSQNNQIPHESTYEFQASNFEENKPIKAIFKRISSANTANGAGRTGNYIGRISNEEEEQALYYRGFCGSYDEKNGVEQIEEIETKDPNSKAFLNSFFEEEILKISPTIGNGSEIESHHYIFSLPSYTRTLQNKILPKEELNKIIKKATISTIKNNEILKTRAVEVAIHEENHAHLNFCATNFQGKKDLRYITKAQQMDILRDFSKECRNLGLNVEIPKKEKPLDLKQLNKIVNIEFKENSQIKAITLQNEQGTTKRLMAVSINDFVSQNKLKLGDKISIEIQKNQYGRNFYKLLDKEETQEQEEPQKIEVDKQKEELDRLLLAEQQRQEKERQEEREEKRKAEQKEILQDIIQIIEKSTFQTKEYNDNAIERAKNSLSELKNISISLSKIEKENHKEIERILHKNEIERTL